MRINGRLEGQDPPQGQEMPGCIIYPFFLVHMGMFGLSGFLMAYSDDGPGLGFLYAHGGFACFVYLIFYLTIFGLDKVRWMFINAGLGFFGIYAQIDWILSWFGKEVSDFSVWVHAIPFLYYILYTFLLHQMVLDLTRSRDNPNRRLIVDLLYIGLSLLIYGILWQQGSD